MTVSDEVSADRSTADADSSSVEEGRPSTDGDRSPEDGSITDADRAAVDGGSAATGGQSPVTVFRWTCPICGESRTGMASGDENPRAKAEFSLRQHVETSDGDGHGRANAYPPRFDPDAADRAVVVD